MATTLNELKGRYLVIAWFVTWLFIPIELIMPNFEGLYEWYWWDIMYYLPGQLLLGMILLFVGIYVRLNVPIFLGSLPKLHEVKGLLLFFSFLWILSHALDFIIFYPLSIIEPEFVTWWYIDIPPVLYTDQGHFPVVPNIISFISLVILSPILEEILFRGYLLRRWSYKWGVLPAIFISSFIFGIAHPDIISATVFGISMCVVYLRSGSLIVVILFHAIWNLLYWLFELNSLMSNGLDYHYTLEEFQSSWPLGVISIFASLLIALMYLKYTKFQKIWRLPVV